MENVLCSQLVKVETHVNGKREDGEKFITQMKCLKKAPTCLAAR